MTQSQLVDTGVRVLLLQPIQTIHFGPSHNVEGTQGRFEHLLAHRFAQHAVTSCLEGHFLDGGRVLSGECDDRAGVLDLLTEQLGGLVAIHDRHAQVHEHGVVEGGVRLHHGDGNGAMPGHVTLDDHLLEGKLQHALTHSVVVHHQNVRPASLTLAQTQALGYLLSLRHIGHNCCIHMLLSGQAVHHRDPLKLRLSPIDGRPLDRCRRLLCQGQGVTAACCVPVR
mmetsp:Transcript_50906/g.90958  ORF Transcript_50906/g.90958 Transcript_50906/m.90958 type:complete len:225 (-) Transcript_50906:1636-2310(-)